MRDDEANRFSARAARYARVGANAGLLAARLGVNRLAGGAGANDARALADALGALKGPMMKVAQLLATVPDLLPNDYAEALTTLQSHAPAMGPSFVRRRMQAELGPNWQSRFQSFDATAAAAASLGQVHRAISLDGQILACKLQYPDMGSAVEADLRQLDLLFALHRRMGAAIDTREFRHEVAARLREELDYAHEAKCAALYRLMLSDYSDIQVPRVRPELSTGRLMTAEWLDGERLHAVEGRSQALRNAVATALFHAWWVPFLRYGVIHGDPHLGNYSILREGEELRALNLFDFGCVRVFPPSFVEGIVSLTRALKNGDGEALASAYARCGFRRLSPAARDAVTIWARFLCAPILEDRERTIADGVKPGEFGRREMGRMMRALKGEDEALAPPREFVFFDRAAIGLGAAFLRLGARLNFHRLFEAPIADFDVEALAKRQREALSACRLEAEARRGAS